MILMDKGSWDKIVNRPMVISMVGLCGSGKSTLAKKLSKKLDMKIVAIGEYRDSVYRKRKSEGYLSQDEGTLEERSLMEWEAWLAFFDDCLYYLWDEKSIIIDTSGLNKRLEYLLDSIWSFAKLTKIKLKCPLNKLKERVKKRKKRQREFFPYSYGGHSEFNKELLEGFKKTYGNITVDTSKLNAQQVYKKVMKEFI